MKPELKVMRLEEGVNLPSFGSYGAAGADLCANEYVIILPGKTAVIKTGLYFEIPFGYEVQIRSRSGLAAKGVMVANSPGTIDSDYRGEIMIILINHRNGEFEVNKGDRIAQMVFAKVQEYTIFVVNELESTERGEGGLGSTGVK